MKRLILKSIILIFIPVVLTSLFMLLKKDAYSVYAGESHVAVEYKRMKSLGDTTKMVIIAGSNGSFGINSQILKDSFNMPIVNTCTHAGIGVRMQFEMFKELLHKGDIVIFCPEYYDGKNRLYGESTLLRILSTHMPSAYLKFSLGQWIHQFKYIGIHYLESKNNYSYAKEFEGVYSRTAINEYGDIEYPRQYIKMRDAYKFKGSLDKVSLDYYKYVHNYCKNKGIRLVYLPPTLNVINYDDQKAQIDSLVNFMSANGIPYQSSPETYVYPDSMYYETPYHPTSEGANVRTLDLVKDLKRILSI